MNLAIIVQRYGDEFAGGSEYLAKIYAEYLSRSRSVTVITTCSKDYHNWGNDYPEGLTHQNGVTIKRFLSAPSFRFFI